MAQAKVSKARLESKGDAGHPFLQPHEGEMRLKKNAIGQNSSYSIVALKIVLIKLIIEFFLLCLNFLDEFIIFLSLHLSHLSPNS